jgi:hypothetical protein
MRAVAIRDQFLKTVSKSGVSGRGHEPKNPIFIASRWDPARFAREQIYGLVRHVFLGSNPASQIVFSGVDDETDVRAFCMRAGEILATETRESVAILTRPSQFAAQKPARERAPSQTSNVGLHELAEHYRESVWILPVSRDDEECSGSGRVRSYLGQVRSEFRYSIVQAAPAGNTGEALALAQFSDGIILVLSARYTRRIAALRAKNAFEDANTRLLGTVLLDREFPIPESVYRWL